jgi:hypothetical protein
MFSTINFNSDGKLVPVGESEENAVNWTEKEMNNNCKALINNNADSNC